MSLKDISIIREAFQQAVKSNDQPENLVEVLLSWYTALTGGNEEIHDPDSCNRRLKILYDKTRIGSTEVV